MILLSYCSKSSDRHCSSPNYHLSDKLTLTHTKGFTIARTTAHVGHSANVEKALNEDPTLRRPVTIATSDP